MMARREDEKEKKHKHKNISEAAKNNIPFLIFL